MSSNLSVRRVSAFVLSAVLLAVWAQTAAAQATGTIRGTVVESGTQRPLAGVQVFIPGTDRGGLSNAAGEFLLLNIPAGVLELRTSMIGYAAVQQGVTVTSGGVARVDLVLTPVAINLDELVVTGTPGAVSKRTLGNSLTTIDAAAVAQQTAISNTMELLQAKAPGVQILANSGTPGAAAEIRIRGASSFIGNAPVVYVDGIRYGIGDLGNFAPSGASTTSYTAQSTSALDLINPQDIESIEVVKGPAAATLYGAEAAGGVIQIITKKGARGAQPLRFDVKAEQAWNDWALEIPTNYTVCTTAKLAERDAAGAAVWPGCQGQSAGSILTDNPMRRDPLALRTGQVQRLSVTARGGSDRISYYVAAQRDGEDGVFHNSYNDRTSLRANFIMGPTDWLDFQLNTSYVQGDLRLPLGDESAQALLLSGARGRPGRVPPVGDPERDGWFSTNAKMANAYNNTATSDRFTVGTTIDLRPRPWFRNRLTLGLDHTTGVARIISPPGSVDADYAGAASLGIVAQRYPRNSLYTVDYAGNIELGLSEAFRSTTSFGVQAISSRYEALYASGRGFGAPDVTLIGTAQVTSGSNSFSESKSLGYYVQEQIGWNSRIYLTGALRLDDHSAFGTNFDLIAYPKVSLAWVFSEEPVLEGLFERLRVGDFKFRAAYGQAGRAPAPFSAVQTYTSDKSVAGDEVRSALRASAFGNPDLRAERGDEYEIGFDAGLFDYRLGVEFTYYNKRMQDLIVPTGVPGSTGFGSTFYGSTSSQLRNLGESLNTGLELSFWGTPIRTQRFAWDARLNLATNHNELIAFGDGRSVEAISAPYGNVQQHRVGYPLAGYWAQLPKRNGDGTPVVNAAGIVQLDSATYIGPSAPTREIGFSSTLTLFRDLRIFALLDYKGGHSLFNYKEYNRCRFQANCARLADPANVELATGAAHNPEVAVWTQSIPGAWIEDASFVKLRDVSLTYSLPATWARKLYASGASFTVAGHNLLQWTDYSGIDPETNTYGNRNFIRVDAYAAPMLRRLSTSLNLTF